MFLAVGGLWRIGVLVVSRWQTTNKPANQSPGQEHLVARALVYTSRRPKPDIFPLFVAGNLGKARASLVGHPEDRPWRVPGL